MNNPPGPKGLPFVGNARHYTRDPLSFMMACRDAYRDVAQFDLGPQKAYLIMDPEAVERVLIHDSERFGRPNFPNDPFADLIGNGLLRSEGELWRRQRGRMQPAFQRDRFANLAAQTVEFTENLISTWEDGADVSVEREMARVTIRVIVRTMMGVKLDEDATTRILDQLEPIGAQFEPSIRGFVLPDWIPSQKRRTFNNAVTELESILQAILAKRQDTSTDGMDIVSILLRDQRDLGDISDDLIRDEMMTMLLAGHDTTELMLTYTWYLLAQHPDAQARVYQEVDAAFKDAESPLEVLDELDYTKRILQETLRLYPPVFAIFREVRQDTRVHGYRLPKGAVVLLPQWVMHRDTRWYENPETFDPDRWLRTPERDRRTGQYFPFGAGPHFCIGRQVSLVEAQTILATIIQQYSLELKDKSQSDLDLRPAITIHPRERLEMTVHERL